MIPPPILSGGQVITNHSENGVSFTGTFIHYSNTVPPSPNAFPSNSSDPSTGYLSMYGSSYLTIQMSDSSLFSLGSIDLAEYSTVFASPKSISFTGYFSGGGTINQMFSTDGTIDGVGGYDDFETFSFVGFNNLTHVVANSVLFAMDNLEVNPSAVPVPAAAFMFAPALLGFFGLRRKVNQSA